MQDFQRACGAGRPVIAMVGPGAMHGDLPGDVDALVEGIVAAVPPEPRGVAGRVRDVRGRARRLRAMAATLESRAGGPGLHPVAPSCAGTDRRDTVVAARTGATDIAILTGLTPATATDMPGPAGRGDMAAGGGAGAMRGRPAGGAGPR